MVKTLNGDLKLFSGKYRFVIYAPIRRLLQTFLCKTHRASSAQ